MPIHVPGPRLGKSIPLEAASKKGHGKKQVYAALNLTAMVDMLTIMVVFLLQTFSASGEIAFVQKNLTLPDATNWVDLERAPVVSVTSEVVTLDGMPMASGEELQKTEGVDMKITQLHDQLVVLKNNFKLINPGTPFPGTVIVQSDKTVDFKILKKVMYSLAVAGYQNMNFAVKPKGKGGG
jgi:biopolymer transport protein ExbD